MCEDDLFDCVLFFSKLCLAAPTYLKVDAENKPHHNTQFSDYDIIFTTPEQLDNSKDSE